MSSGRFTRLSYEESCRFLQQCGLLDGGAVPVLPDRRPDMDGVEGVRFFRAWIGAGRPFGLAPSASDDEAEAGDLRLVNLTLPRTFVLQSEISSISFANTNLSESTLCWNDVIEVDFTDADLSGADLRASIFRRVTFVRTNLRNADLRHSTLDECDFTNAEMAGTKLTRGRSDHVLLSSEQRQAVDWQESDGSEPLGG